MDFSTSPQSLALQRRLRDFMRQYILPYNAAWHQSVQEGVYPPAFVQDLKTLAQDEGLWNLFLPQLCDD